ncbi:hypothetical protein A3F59_02625 [Candidatus Roizmanbacteria bacterium RIFCSPHIGHO2_12_FULL_38_13]|nr:MAG: hypothetical protein A3F59_02625 [Candidatus Roizmanbacteria bacterium RIFCSPHIGHO2_12_FULL_38_13]
MKPTAIIIHHELGNHGFWGVNDFHKQLWNFKSSLGFYIAYQYYIGKDGIVYQGRLDDEEGCHTKGRNFDSIGICLQGDFDIERPTLAQTIALKNLILKKMTYWAILPNNIYGHRIYANYKSCPGRSWKESELRALFEPDANYYQNLLNSLKDWLLKVKVGALGSKATAGCIDIHSRG